MSAKRRLTYIGPWEPFGAERDRITVTLTLDEYTRHAWAPKRSKLRKPMLRYRVWRDLETREDGEQVGLLIWEGKIERGAPWVARQKMAQEQERQADLYVKDQIYPERLAP